MDLKTFAVYQKLLSNSTLLEYIVNNENIPVNVVEDNMKELLEPLQHSESEAIVNNYREHLRNTVKTSFTKKEDNVFDVNGHIDDPVIESIELLHGVDREDVVRDVVSNVMGDLNSERHVEIESVLLSEEADDFLRMATKPLFSSDISQTIDVEPDEEIDHLLDEVLSSEDIVNDDAVEEDVVQDIELEDEEVVQDIELEDEEVVQDIELEEEDVVQDIELEDEEVVQDIELEDEEVVQDIELEEEDVVQDIELEDEEVVQDIELEEEDVVQDIELEEEDVVQDIELEEEEVVHDIDPSDLEDIESLEEPLRDLDVPSHYDDESVEDTIEDVPVEEETQAHAFKQAYDFLIEQLHEKGLVDKLPGLHVPQV